MTRRHVTQQNDTQPNDSPLKIKKSSNIKCFVSIRGLITSSVIMLSYIMLSVILLRVILQNVILLSVVLLRVLL
jgi:hypothetical protein